MPSPVHAVVTGSSSGIGQQIAIDLARRFGEHEHAPVKILVHYRKNAAGAAKTAKLVEQNGATVDLVQANLCSDEDRKRLIDRAWSFLGSPTTWINNAGADVLTGDAAKLDFHGKLKCLVETDVLATIDLSRQVVDRMRADLSTNAASAENPPASITFIGWDQAPLGMEGDAGQMFGPTKAAVMAFANSLAQECAPEIRVNTIAPGWIRTAWGEATDSYWDQRAKSQSMMRRWGTPEDVARAVCFVADPENTFCCGETVSVNGGWNRTHHRDA